MVWLVCSVFGLLGIVAYAAAWIVMPEEPYLLAVPEGNQQMVANK